MRVIKPAALALLQCLAIIVLSAQQPNITVTLENSTQFQHPFDDVIKLPNGDLQFYDFTAEAGNIQVTGFQYHLQDNTLTGVTQIGSISGIQGECQRILRTQRFGKFYSVYEYPDGYNPQGVVLIRLDANDFAYRIIDNMGFSAGSTLFRTEIVAEDTFVFALEDSLVYYDFSSETSRTLLSGDAYQCSIQEKRVYAMPDGHFMYVKDSVLGYDSVPETWVIYDSQGNYQFTRTLADPYFGITWLAVSFHQDFQSINGRFYIPNINIDSDDGWLECHFPSPDSLHLFAVTAPGSIHEGYARFVRFGDNRVLRAYFDYWEDRTNLYMNFSPLEYNPVPTQWTSIGSLTPHFNNLNDDIVTVSMRQEDYILVSALCTLDFPSPHTFMFPAPPVNVYLPSFVFSQADTLLFVNNGRIYVFLVEFTLPNSDETEASPVLTLSAYPNPVNLQDVITFKAPVNHVLELDIFNIRGQRVDTVTLNPEGTAQWDLRNNEGSALSAGVYIAKPRNQKGIKPVRFIAVH